MYLKELEVPEEVVVEGEELEVELGQGQEVSAVVVLPGDDVLVPDDLLSRVQRHLVQLLELRVPLLVPISRKTLAFYQN